MSRAPLAVVLVLEVVAASSCGSIPAWHSSASRAPADAVQVPEAQALQDVAPKASFQDPAGHREHADAPAEAANFPGPQPMHTVWFA